MLDNRLIGMNICRLRKQHQMTQVELANQLNISHQAVSKWEQGDSLPDIGTLLLLSRIFSKSIEKLLLVEETERTEADTEELWQHVLIDIKEHVSKPSFNTWFLSTTATQKGDSFVVISPNRFMSEWLQNRYVPLITSILAKYSEFTGQKLIFTCENM